MKVTKIEKDGKYKYKVFIEDEYMFWLSYKELYHWKLKENCEITEEYLQQILKESVLAKCKRKAISYLQYCNRTEYELRDKLKQQLYLEPIIDKTMEYLYEYQYIDDDRYVSHFIDTNKANHSKKWMVMKLQQKGLRREDIEKYFGEDYSEEEALYKAIRKKVKGRRIEERAEREKVLAYLCRQGYSFQFSKNILKKYEEEMYGEG